MRGRKTSTALVRESAGHSGFLEHSEALFLTSSFTFASAAMAAEKFALPMPDYVYSRFSNPTVKTLTRRAAAMEGAQMALATASGMSAILSLVMGVCKSGDHILCGASAFGTTLQLLGGFFPKFGVQVQFLPSVCPEEWRKAAKENTALMIVESPTNPTLEIADIAALADIARNCGKDGGALLAVDNCFCPFAQRPLSMGADVVLHSATKYLDGQGRILGGIIAGGEDLLQERIFPFLRSGGPAMSPFNAWVAAKGLETLPLRMRAHSASALQIAGWLQEQPQAERVLHTGLTTHPNHELAMRQQNGMGGGIISFYVKSGGKNGKSGQSGRAAAWRFIDNLHLFSITANFGDAKSTISHPATTTHAKVAPALREKLGINDNLVRLSIGLEDAEDIQNDIAAALAKI
ncbi:MAG: O-succinylhomoserine sulfhydrylase [Gammaproteobacteria bacterium]